MQPICLSIAGFDGSGGAGIQADLKTFSALGCYGLTILTALTAQNTCGVKSCYPMPLQAIKDQLAAIFEDIPPDSIKIGMLFSESIIDCIASFLAIHAKKIPIVLDPVMFAKSGDRLLAENAILTLKQKLFPLTSLITPNLPEAKYLVAPSADESDENHLTALVNALKQLNTTILLKGGHAQGDDCDDLLIDKNHVMTLKAKRILSKNTHGTGCTLSSAICAYLAHGEKLFPACQKAKAYLYASMKASQHQSIGKGSGPVDHFHHIRKWLPYSS